MTRNRATAEEVLDTLAELTPSEVRDVLDGLGLGEATVTREEVGPSRLGYFQETERSATEVAVEALRIRPRKPARVRA
jgi:hypothetical protein